MGGVVQFVRSVFLLAIALGIAGTLVEATGCVGREAARAPEKIICSNDFLANEDKELAEAYFQATNELKGENLKVLVNTQKEWLLKRDKCLIERFLEEQKISRECSMAELSDRLKFLKIIASEAKLSKGPIKIATELTPQIEGIYCEPTTSTIINGESEDEVNLVEDILIKRTSDPLTIDFGVYVSGPNGHDCVLGGPAVFTEDKKFTYSEGPGEKDCRVIIQISDSYISLDNNRYCSEYCGARASLNSSFRRENRIPFSSTSSKEVSCPI